MQINYQIRYASHPLDVKNYDTSKIREHFLVDRIMVPDEINMVYSHFDRFIVGGALPMNEKLYFKTIEPLKSEYFLERRELGIFNVGNKGKVTVDDQVYEMNNKEALYIGKGRKVIIFESCDKSNPARFYFNSAPAHQTFPDKKVTKNTAEIVVLGTLETSNHRTINKMLVNSVLQTCQLQMGMTELKPGSVWNTMPAHIHDRRMEVYFYFEIPEDQSVCHFLGEPQETRHIWLLNEQAVISPDWSIHSAAATFNYVFIWGMAGENLNYSDMDNVKITDLK